MGDHARVPGEVERARLDARGQRGGEVKRDHGEHDLPAPLSAGRGRERERARMPDGHDEVVGGDPRIGEVVEERPHGGELVGGIAFGQRQRVHEETLIGKATAQLLDESGGRVGLRGERAGARPSDRGGEVVGDAAHDPLAHAQIKRRAAQGHPLAPHRHLGLLGGPGLPFRGIRRRLGGLFAHSRPFSQSSWPLSRATCSKLFFLMSMRMSALASYRGRRWR